MNLPASYLFASILRRLIVGALMLAGATMATAQTTTTMSLADARSLSAQALAAGDPVLAITVAQAILAQTPDDYPVLIVLALAQTQLEQHDAAAETASHAFRVAGTDAEKQHAARIVAGAHFRMKHHTRAQMWLRRAANFAKDEQEIAVIDREFGAVRQQNPLSVQLSFSVNPTNNINNGSSETIFYVGDLAFVLSADSQALSGIEYSAQTVLSYRLSEDARHRTEAGLQLYGRTYSLSEGSRAAVPTASGSDYSLLLAEASLSHRALLFDDLGVSTVSAHFGQNWYGGDPLWRYGRIVLSQEFPIGDKAAVTVQGFVERELALSNENTDTWVYDLDASYARRLGNNDVLRVSLGTRISDAELATSDYDLLRTAVQYDFNRPVLNTRLSLSLDLSRKDYETYALSATGRHDKSVSVGASMVFEKLSYFGFSPSLTLKTTSTSSNISRFSTDTLSARLGVQSSF